MSKYGQKIQLLARVLMVIALVSLLIFPMAWATHASSRGGSLISVYVMILTGSLGVCGLVSCLPMMAFGQLVTNSDIIVQKMSNQ